MLNLGEGVRRSAHRMSTEGVGSEAMGFAITVRVEDTEVPEFGSVGYAVGEGPDGSTVRFYADLTIVRDLRDRIEGGEVPEITVPAEQFILSADHWACR